MKKLYPIILAFVFTMVCTVSAWGQTNEISPDVLPEIPEIPGEFEGMTYADILQSGDSYNATLDFAVAQNWNHDRGEKVFLYRFTVSELTTLTLQGSYEQSNENAQLGKALLWRKGQYQWMYHDHGFYANGFYSDRTSTDLVPGVYFLVLTDDDFYSYFGSHAQVSLYIHKTATPVTPLMLPYDNTLNVSNGVYWYSFCPDSPATLDIAVSNVNTGGYGDNAGWLSVYSSDWESYNTGVSLQEDWVSNSPLFYSETYYIRMETYYQNNSFRLQLIPQTPEVISLPYDQNITLQANKIRVMQFTLADERLVVLKGARVSDGYADIQVVGSDGESVMYNYLDDYVDTEMLPAGTYYVLLRNHKWDGETIVNMKINAIDVSAAPSYTAIDYSTPLQKGVLLSGALTEGSLGYYEVITTYEGDYDSNGDGVIDENDRQQISRQYGLMTGFSLAVEAGRQYTFSGIASGTGIVVLKNGMLSGNLLSDLRAVNMEGSEKSITYTASESGTSRVLVVLFDDVESGAYTLKVTESGVGAPVISIPELCASATVLAYSASLSETLNIDFNDQTPRVQVGFSEESEMQGLQWVSPAKVYKMNVPADNQGIHIRTTGNNYLCLYLKKGEEYQPFIQTYGIYADEIPVEYTGDWYVVFVNEPFAPISSFTADIWVTTPPVNSGGATVREMLDNAPAVTLPYSISGNTVTDGTVISESELDSCGIYVYRPSKVVARKITLTSSADKLYVQSGFDYVALFKVSDGNQAEPDVVDEMKRSRRWFAHPNAVHGPSFVSCLKPRPALPLGVTGNLQKLSRSVNTGNDYEKIYSAWNGNFEYCEYGDWYYDETLQEYVYSGDKVPAGDYWLIGVFEYDGDQAYWLQVSTTKQELAVVSVTANASGIGVNAGATEPEIKALLSLLKLTAVLNNDMSVPMENYAGYWNLAADGQTATLNCTQAALDNFHWLVLPPGEETLNIPPFTVQISYTGNEIPDGLRNEKITGLLVYTVDRQIHVSGIGSGSAYGLFDLTGKLLVSGKTVDDALVLRTPCSGVYLLRLETTVVKLVVK